MSDELPRNWATAPLTSLAKKFRGVSYGRDEASAGPKKGFVPILRANNLQNDRLTFDELVWVPADCVSDQQKLRTGDIVVAMSSGSKSIVGKTAQLMEDWHGSFGAFCGVLRSWPEVNSRYVGLFLRTREYRSSISELAAGSNINNLKNEHLAAIEVPLAPLAEQRRIVAKLEKLLDKVDVNQKRLAKIPVLLKRFRQSVLAAACSGRLTADWREDAKESELAFPEPLNSKAIVDVERIFETPENWRWLPLVALCDPSRFICYGVIKLGADHPNGIPCLRTSDVKPLRIDTSAVKRIAPRISNEYRRTLLRGGEVLVNVRGTLGGVSVVSSELRDWNISREVALVPIAGVLPKFVAFWIASMACQNWLTGMAKGVAYTGINIEDLRLLPVALPPLLEQQEIVRRVEGLFALVGQLEVRMAKTRAQVDKLTPSLLARAFRGELVPQDPNDEPALVLLERIRKQRNGADEKVNNDGKRARRRTSSRRHAK